MSLKVSRLPAAVEPRELRASGAAVARALLLAGCVLAVLRAIVVAPVWVEGASMLPTFQSRQLLWVDKLAYGLCWSGRCALRWGEPRPGDVIVAAHPASEGGNWIKRVVAVPGDWVEMRAGQLWRNGERVSTGPGPHVFAWDASTPVLPLEKLRVASRREYLGTRPHLVIVDAQQSFERVKVPADHVWLLGDHRGDSRDSRAFGSIPVRAVLGRVSL